MVTGMLGLATLIIPIWNKWGFFFSFWFWTLDQGLVPAKQRLSAELFVPQA